jgi:UDP-N-acetylglucosamine 2-epimerase (non-hydrolysing)
MFIAVCYGTRPEYLKLLPFIKLLSSTSIPHKVYRILQHIELNESSDFQEVLVTVRGDISNRLNAIGVSILEKLDSVFDKSHTHCVVQGDTSTALFCALYAFHNKIQVVHIEAGLRTYNIHIPWPEEANRQIISRIASFHFTPHHECTELLNKEHVAGTTLTVGNTILDLIKSYELSITQDNIVLITFHRRENWDKIDIFIGQLKQILTSDSNIHFFWCMHPNPELQTKIRTSFESCENLTLSPPLNHKDFTRIMAKSKYIITDSGGLQEEASFLGKQCLVLREMTERYHIPYPYIHLIKDIGTLAKYVDRLSITKLDPCNVYGDGTASEKILRYLLN